MAAFIVWAIAFMIVALLTGLGEWLTEKLKPKPDRYRRKAREKRHKELVTRS